VARAEEQRAGLERERRHEADTVLALA
jgi:hypothetical protein